MLMTYQGGCHCGAVRFTAGIDLAAGTSKCNCSICRKARFWKAVIKADDFRLEQGADAVTEYRFEGATGAGIRHFFCSRCGVKPFGRGSHPDLGDFVGINVACLDAPDEEIAAAPVVFQDGKNNAWGSTPAETRHL